MAFFFNRQMERAAYVRLRLSLAAGWCAVMCLKGIAPLLRRRRTTKDFLFFPYMHKDNIGARSRFQEYFPLLKNDGFRFDVHYHATREAYHNLFLSPAADRAAQYRHYRQVFWQRLRWVLKAPRYKAVFVQRALFPHYYDQTNALLEQLLRVLHRNITVDYYDADYARNEAFYHNIIRRFDKVAVVNKPLFEYFSRHHPRVLFNDLSVDGSAYPRKSDYTLHQPVRLFWTGSVTNARLNLVPLMPVLEAVNRIHPITLVMVTLNTAGLTQPFIEHHLYDTGTFATLMREADIALYAAMEDNVYSRGKVAYKQLEYAAVKIPMVASPQGLSPYFVPETDILLATNEEEWKQQLIRLIGDASLRQRLANAAHEKFLQHHDTQATYKTFLSILTA